MATHSKSKGSGKSRGRKRAKSRRTSLVAGLLILVAFALWACFADWYVHHPNDWRKTYDKSLPKFVKNALYTIGNRTADFTDAINLTGSDCVYEYDEDAPKNSVFFAGAPIRMGYPAPEDITILNREHFIIGYSPSLRHPVWVAYHVVPNPVYPNTEHRPPFKKDRDCPTSPSPQEYTCSGYDRGHMAPNYAMLTRYGEEVRNQTFLMSNITPQSPELNRGVWKDIEHRIAEYWTASYGEIWVIVGCFSTTQEGAVKIRGSIDIPEYFYQIIIAQKGTDVRAMAILLPQKVYWDTYAARHLISIDNIESLTGLNFNPKLPNFIQDPLEAECPNRLWPVKFINALSILFSNH